MKATTSKVLALAQCAWALATGHAQNTNPPQFFQPSKAAAGAPVVLKWASDPLTVYSIEYNTALSSNHWHLVQDNFPAQGTNTWWSDTGSESLLSPRLSSADPLAPYRFYRLRVERYMSNSSPVTASIANVSEGAVLSGLVDVQASGAASQGVISAKLYVDGDLVGVEAGSTYTFPLETRYYPNGTHRLSVVAQDAGGLESTEETNPATGLGATYGATNITVVFSNDLSSVRLRHKAFRPDLGQTQHISAVWTTVRLWRIDITPADDISTVLRSFSGDSTEISFSWDGRNASGGQIAAQAVGYHFFDLGPGMPPPPPGGGGGSPPPVGGESSMAGTADSALFPASPWEALSAGLTSYFVKPPPMPPLKVNGVWVPWEEVYGPLPPTEITISETQQQRFLEQLAVKSSDIVVSGSQEALLGGGGGPTFSVFWPIGRLGTMGVLSQGHHPRFGSYPPPSRGPGLGPVRMSSRDQDGPWGPLVAPGIIAADCMIGFPSIGYQVLVKNSDNFCSPADLRSQSAGGSNTLNQVNIGLFTGHSSAGRDIELSIGYLQSYVPIYKKTNNTMTWVKSSEMDFGSTNLSWMAFYSCNMFRDSLYRDDGIYEDMKANFGIPMNGWLHVLQGFATENSIHPDMVVFWTRALARKTPNASEHTVLGAWKFVCLQTQPKETVGDANVSRSIYWPECAGDYIYGWGPQTTPNRSPDDRIEQADLQEDDQRAPQP